MNKLIPITFLSLLLNACSTLDYMPNISLFKPYKADIDQGSVLERFTINQLKIGMSKHQVYDIIGQPSITDPFHNNQWDYVHYTTLGSDEIIHYRLTLIFEGDKLSNINTDGISSLPEMTNKEKTKERERLAKEKQLKEKRIAEEKALEEARIAKEEELEKIRLAKEKTLEKANLNKEKTRE